MRQNVLAADSVQVIQPEPLPHPCEMLPHLYPQRKYEHGDTPGWDSEDESEYMHHKRQNGGEEPDVTPGWARHLRLKLRIAQKGHVRAIAPSSLDAAGIQASPVENLDFTILQNGEIHITLILPCRPYVTLSRVCKWVGDKSSHW